MKMQCLTIYNKQPCGQSVNYIFRKSSADPQYRVFCSYKCFTDTYKDNLLFCTVVDKERQAFVIYLEALGPGMGTLIDAHPLRWYARKYPNLKWDLWNSGTTAQMSTSGAHPPPDPFLELDENTPVLENSFADESACMCLAGHALTCKVPEGEHWGQPGYRGGEK